MPAASINMVEAMRDELSFHDKSHRGGFPKHDKPHVARGRQRRLVCRFF
jgi:hypothetical protein